MLRTYLGSAVEDSIVEGIQHAKHILSMLDTFSGLHVHLLVELLYIFALRICGNTFICWKYEEDSWFLGNFLSATVVSGTVLYQNHLENLKNSDVVDPPLRGYDLSDLMHSL